jgi:hypothetical protein
MSVVRALPQDLKNSSLLLLPVFNVGYTGELEAYFDNIAHLPIRYALHVNAFGRRNYWISSVW